MGHDRRRKVKISIRRESSFMLLVAGPDSVIIYQSHLNVNILADRVHYVLLDSPPILDSVPVAAEFADRVAIAAFSGPAPVKIRKEFPESWIWETLEDTGCDIYAMNP